MSDQENKQVNIERHVQEMKLLNQKVSAFTKELTLIKLDLGDLINVNIDLEKRFYTLEKHMQSLPGFVLVNDFAAGMEEMRELVNKAHTMGLKAITAKDELTHTVNSVEELHHSLAKSIDEQVRQVLEQFGHTKELMVQTRAEAERYRKRLNILNILVAALIGIIVVLGIVWISGNK